MRLPQIEASDARQKVGNVSCKSRRNAVIEMSCPDIKFIFKLNASAGADLCTVHT